jgi:glucose-6-phosphate 1-dehydrogenase
MSDSLSHTIHCNGDDSELIEMSGEPIARHAPPCIITIFGATGDLNHRKLMPALFDLRELALLPENVVIVGYGRSEHDEDEFRKGLAKSVHEFNRLDWDAAAWKKFEERIFYQQGAYDEMDSFVALDKRLDELEEQFQTGGNRLFYMATPPGEFAPIIEGLGQLKKKNSKSNKGWWRLIVEKPVGFDLQSARELNQLLAKYFSEQEVFRIDHYLGKETVQNILVLRFANAMWEPLWNNRHIDHVQILVGEQVGVGRRGGYYETSGALRDMVVNHMLQLLSLVAMEPPVALDANSIRDEKVKALRSVRVMDASGVRQNTLRGQYEGYLKEKEVSRDSHTETYVALKLAIDNWRWSGVPFYLRHGKALEKRATEIVIRWKDTPHVLFNKHTNRVKSNMMVLRIQPQEGFAVRVNAKVPGSGTEIRDVRMDFDYTDAFDVTPPEAYERLLHDALRGDSTLFTRRDEVEVEWAIADPILENWARDDAPPFRYPKGSWGPDEANDFLARDGRRWHQPLTGQRDDGNEEDGEA